MEIRNFSAGPGALPRSVLREAQQAVLSMPGTGLSILGLSHRTPQFRDMLDEAEERLRQLLDLPPGYHVLFLQGGGTLQFSMVPLAMLPTGGVADYVVSGYWSQKAVEAGRCHGNIRVVWDGSGGGFRRLPGVDEPAANPDAAYLHYVSNETVEGLQFRRVLPTTRPLVCDMSSDFLSGPLDIRPFSLVYAHAQKNLGPAGVTVVVLRDEVLAGSPPGIPPILDYRAHVEARSVLHTPPVFSIYVVLLTLRWMANEVGGLEAMGRINAEKARIVRTALTDNARFYAQDVEPGSESDMNVTFRCPTPDLDALFAASANQAGLVGTEGHRSRGGLRISLFNAVTVEDAQAVATFLAEFAHQHRHEGDRDAASVRHGRGVNGDGAKVTRFDPNAALAYVSSGRSKDSLRDFVGAIADYDRAIEIDPTEALAYLHRGNARVACGDFEGSIADYTRSIELNPRQARVYSNRGVARSGSGDYGGAIADLSRAIALDPCDAALYYNRALVHREHGHPDDAFADFARVVELDPHAAMESFDRGLTKGEQGDHDGAIADLTRAIELDPYDALAFTQRGKAKEARGDGDGARADFARATELNPDARLPG